MTNFIPADRPFVGIRVGADTRPLLVDYDVGSILIDRGIDVRPSYGRDQRPKMNRLRPDGKRYQVDRWIMDAKRNEVVFHKNGSMFDCRRINMQVVTKQQYCGLYDQRIADDKEEPLMNLKMPEKSGH